MFSRLTSRISLSGGRGSGIGFCDSFGHDESVTFSLGAGLTRAVAEVVDGVCHGYWVSSGVGHRLSDGFGSTLELVAGLAGTMAELVDGFHILGRKRSCGCSRVDRGDGQESGVDDSGELHLG